MTPLIPALTIHQPWAWAISVGHKLVENREWAAPVGAPSPSQGTHPTNEE